MSIYKSDKGSDDNKAIEDLIHRAFYIGKNKELSSIREVHHSMLTKFSDTPPHHMMDYEEACLHEEMFFANISDYDYSIEDLRITLLDESSSVALATFILEYKGIVVDDYSFTGQTIKGRVRCTIICKKFDGRWYIVHEHLSSI
ncbi:MAG: nuclear transport factor 2 family protein [Candidatus Nitrosocaldus sp.]